MNTILKYLFQLKNLDYCYLVKYAGSRIGTLLSTRGNVVFHIPKMNNKQQQLCDHKLNTQTQNAK